MPTAVIEYADGSKTAITNRQLRLMIERQQIKGSVQGNRKVILTSRYTVGGGFITILD